MMHQLEIVLFIIVMAIAVVEFIYWTIVSVNRIMDYLFKTKMMSKELTLEDRLDAIYNEIDGKAEDIARNETGYILDEDDSLGSYQPKKARYDTIKRHYRAGAIPYGERLAASEDRLQKAELNADRYEKALKEIQAKAKNGIFPHLPVETMGAQMCIEIDQYITELLIPKQTADE